MQNKHVFTIQVANNMTTWNDFSEQLNRILNIKVISKADMFSGAIVEMIRGVQHLLDYENIIVGNDFHEENKVKKFQDPVKAWEIVQQALLSKTIISSFDTIDWHRLKDFNFETVQSGLNEIGTKKEGSSDIISSIEVVKPQKMLTELTVNEFEVMLEKSVDEKKRKFSMYAFLFFLFEDCVKEIAFAIMNMVLSIMMSLTISTYNLDIKVEIMENIKETQTISDLRKITTKYMDKSIIGTELGFLRKDSYIRKGRSKNAPAIEKVSEKTILSVIRKNGNWLLVQVDNSEACFMGWIEESKVILFKKK